MDYYDARDPDLTSECEEDLTNRIEESFRGSTIFITGASGFLGKLLLEKLLRSCSSISKILLLMRSKKGVAPEQRLKELLQESLFAQARQIVGPELMNKVEVINGDCSSPNLGMTSEDLNRVIREVNFIFHVAASLRMDEPIKAAYCTNIRSTKDLLEASTKMENIKAFIYMSTAYSCSENKVIEEKFYDSPFSQMDLEQYLEVCTDSEAEILMIKCLGEISNAYAFTKRTAEDLVSQYRDRVPVGLVRPSIVVGCAEEPLAGWVGSINGPTGVLLGAAIGLIKVWGTRSDLKASMIPADYFINNTIAAAWNIAKLNSSGELKSSNPVYNFTSSNLAPTNYGIYYDTSEHSFQSDKLMLKQMIIPYHFWLQDSYFWFRVQTFLFHFIPAFVVDNILKALGKQPMLLGAYRKIRAFNAKLWYYCINEWEIKEENTQLLWSLMNKKEQKEFKFDMTGFRWESFNFISPRGIKVYLLKEDMQEKKSLWNSRSWQIRSYFYVILTIKFTTAFSILLYLYSSYCPYHINMPTLTW